MTSNRLLRRIGLRFNLQRRKVMKGKASRESARERGGGWHNAVVTAAAAFVTAVVPVFAVLALGLSDRARRALATRFVPDARAVDVARRLGFGWAAGFAAVMVGQAVGAAVGPMSMLDPVGLLAHTVFALSSEVVMATVTVLVLRRSHPAVVPD